MRIQLFGSSLLAVAALVGCGGDDGHIKVPDAKVFKDAAIDAPHVCTTKATLNALSIGSMTAGATTTGGTWFAKDMTSGTVYFDVGGKLSMASGLDDDATADIMIFALDVPAGGFVTGVAYPFQTDPTADDQSKESVLYGDVDSSGMMSAATLWPQASTPASALTFSKVTTQAVSGTQTTPDIIGTVNAVKYAEIDQMTGAVIPGGCTTNLAGFNFFLRQTTAAPARLAPPSDGTIDPVGTYSNPVLVHNRAEAIEFARQQILNASN